MKNFKIFVLSLSLFSSFEIPYVNASNKPLSPIQRQPVSPFATHIETQLNRILNQSKMPQYALPAPENAYNENPKRIDLAREIIAMLTGDAYARGSEGKIESSTSFSRNGLVTTHDIKAFAKALWDITEYDQERKALNEMWYMYQSAPWQKGPYSDHQKHIWEVQAALDMVYQIREADPGKTIEFKSGGKYDHSFNPAGPIHRAFFNIAHYFKDEFSSRHTPPQTQNLQLMRDGRALIGEVTRHFGDDIPQNVQMQIDRAKKGLASIEKGVFGMPLKEARQELKFATDDLGDLLGEERTRAAEAQRLEQERRAAEVRRAEAEAQRREQERRAAEAQRLEQERREAEAQRREQEQRAAEVRRAEAEAQRREQERRAAEVRRAEAEAQRLEQERREAEAQRREQEQRAAEAQRLEQERRAAEAEAQRREQERTAETRGLISKAENLLREIYDKKLENVEFLAEYRGCVQEDLDEFKKKPNEDNRGLLERSMGVLTIRLEEHKETLSKIKEIEERFAPYADKSPKGLEIQKSLERLRAKAREHGFLGDWELDMYKKDISSRIESMKQSEESNSETSEQKKNF